MEGCAIASPNMRPRRDVPQDGVRRNEMIRAREVRVIGADGEQLGILQRNEAIALAKEAGMDLVEVASTSEPPVCRIMDYGKFKYEQQKKKQEAKKRQSVVQIKEIKVRPKTDDHDYETKLRHIRRFLEDGDRCKVTVFFRGREIVHKDRGISSSNASCRTWPMWPRWTRSPVPKAAPCRCCWCPRSSPSPEPFFLTSQVACAVRTACAPLHFCTCAARLFQAICRSCP